MGEPKKNVLFICYSHTDQEYKERFDKFLQGDALKEKMEIFSDARIKPGEEWQPKIVECLQKATAALMLVSQDFMISPFIQQVELRELLAAQFRRGLRLYLVPVRATFYEGTYLERFQWARPPNKPLSLLSKQEQEQAMVDVCHLIASELTRATDAPTIERNLRCLESIPKLDLPPIYELEGKVGEGQFARCYLARDRLLDRNVIIKVLHEELSRDSQAYDRYVHSASLLKHRNIVGPLFSQTSKLPHFIVTPAIDGDTMKEKLAKRTAAKRPTFDDSVKWTIQIAETLHYAHTHDCLHGRLRPCEVRVDSEDQPMLAGFRTKAWRAHNSTKRPLADPVTLEDFAYASPETRKHGTVDEKSDQYLLGLLAYELISGSKPAQLVSWASLLDPRVAEAIKEPRPLKHLPSGCNPRVSDVIMKALSVDPADRWSDLHAMAVKLGEAISGTYCHGAARESYRRCAQKAAFYETVYARLFQLMPESRAMFKDTSLERQYQVLRDAIWLLLTYPGMHDQVEPTILSGVARTHTHLLPGHYDKFRDAILDAVAEHDSAESVDAWRTTMQPGFEYLKRQLVHAPPPPRKRKSGNGAAHRRPGA